MDARTKRRKEASQKKRSQKGSDTIHMTVLIKRGKERKEGKRKEKKEKGKKEEEEKRRREERRV